MRKTLLAVFCLIAGLKINAQVVFCPPGAEWHYRFYDRGAGMRNEQIIYQRDSISGSELIKIVETSKFYRQCNNIWISPVFIKQIGDTVFFWNNRTQNSWQILYNFAASQGQGWQTTITIKNNIPVTYNYSVDSVSSININGFNLRCLHVNDPVSGKITITERFGSSQFLFNYNSYSPKGCDGDTFEEFLCYQDDSFGQYQFGTKPCDYSNLVGVSEWNNNNNIKIYPNPVSDVLNIDSQNTGPDYRIILVNIFGQYITTETRNLEQEMQLDLRELQNGIYFLQVFSDGKLIDTKKITKE